MKDKNELKISENYKILSENNKISDELHTERHKDSNKTILTVVVVTLFVIALCTIISMRAEIDISCSGTGVNYDNALSRESPSYIEPLMILEDSNISCSAKINAPLLIIAMME